MLSTKTTRRRRRQRIHHEPLMPTLGIPVLLLLMLLLQQTPTMVSCFHRDGGQPVPSSIIKEARALRARYRHVLTNLDTQRRIFHKLQLRRPRRDLQQTTFSTKILEEHLFQPIQPPADNEDEDTKNDMRSLRQVGLEGTAKPLFFCSQCTKETQHDQEECARCKGLVYSQQQKIITAVKDLFPQEEEGQLQRRRQGGGGAIEVKIVATTQKLINMVFVEMTIGRHDDIAEIDHALSQIPGVQKIVPQEDSTLEDDAAVAYMGGGTPLEQQFCGVGGKGVKVAILDSGVDYTHQRVGGPGTKAAYELAYGTGPESMENKQVNPQLFPTETVIGGRDFLGENFVHTAESVAADANPDDNPIDSNRHGTMVADAILSVAPQAKLLACKVCTSDTGTCPGFSVLQALEYALDPNGDDNMDDKVDIANLSLGGSYLSSYYDLRTEAMERVFELGVLPVVAAGNEGNIPYIGGPGAKTPNAISVAATNGWKKGSYSMVASYSSRGPGDENVLKPDISAPSGLTLAAYGTGNELYRGVQGTSFAAPLVAGALALVKERCPNCSPFALKAILMNNAKRHVQYHTPNVPVGGTALPTDDAPNSLVGAGELELDKSLAADVWAYCVEDTQASLSFGLINAHEETTIKKTIKVMNLSGKEQTLNIRNQFLSKALTEPQQNPLVVSFSPEEQVLPAGCNTEVQFEVTLVVDASKAPPNRMTSGGAASDDPTNNDWNEFGGWVIIENVDTSKDISLAYHSIVRQASNVVVQGTKVIDNFTGGPTPVNAKLTNLGAGVAQVDAYELLFTSEDDPENDYGAKITPSDFRYIGYRVFQPEGKAGTCDYLLEFSFTTWENQKRLNLEFFQVHFDTNFDNQVDYILFNSGVFTPFTDNIGCVVRNKSTGEIKCTGFAPDHSTNTGNTILRVCSNDIGFTTAPSGQQQVNVYILTATATHLGVTEVTDRASEQFHTIEFPKAYISAPSYDIYPGETLETLEIDGTGGDRATKPLGLMLVTNSYRSPSNTGAASASSETIILPNGPQTLPVEVTPDDLAFPVASALQGPECAAWVDVSSCLTGAGASQTAKAGFNTNLIANSASQNPISRIYKMGKAGGATTGDSPSKEIDLPEESKQTRGALHAIMQSSGESEAATCPETESPRSQVLRVPGSDTAATPLTTTATSQPTAASSAATQPATAAPGGVGTTCTEQEVPVSIDLQMKYPEEFYAACVEEEDTSIAKTIAESMQQNFASTVTSWKGQANFPASVTFDYDQEVNNIDPFANGDDDAFNFRQRRWLQGEQSVCPQRSINCESQYCRLSCVTARATNCDLSTTQDWSLLEQAIRSSLADLGLECLGISGDLRVVVQAGPPVDLGTSGPSGGPGAQTTAPTQLQTEGSIGAASPAPTSTLISRNESMSPNTTPPQYNTTQVSPAPADTAPPNVTSGTTAAPSQTSTPFSNSTNRESQVNQSSTQQTVGPSIPANDSTLAPANSSAMNRIVIPGQMVLIYSSNSSSSSNSSPDGDRDLTADEYAQLASLLNEFYSAVFQANPALSADFVSCLTTITVKSYSPGGIKIEFVTDFVFQPESTLSANQVLQGMEGAQYQTFIDDYLQRSNNQLSHLSEAVFEGSRPEAAILSSNNTYAPSNSTANTQTPVVDGPISFPPNQTFVPTANMSSLPVISQPPNQTSVPTANTTQPTSSVSTANTTPPASSVPPLPASIAPVSFPPSTHPPTSVPQTLTPQTGAPSSNGTGSEPPRGISQSPAPTPLRITTRPTGPIATAIDFTGRFKTPTSPIFSSLGSTASPLFAIVLGAGASILALF